jgi:Contractile injection system tube protein
MSILGSVMGAVSSLMGGGGMPLAKIVAYEKNDFTGKIGEIELPLVVDKEMDQTYGIKWDSKDGGTAQGESAPIRTFKGYENTKQDLELEVMIDATGVHTPAVPGINYGSPDISLYLEKLKETVYGYNKSGHSAPYLMLVWGAVFASESTAKGTKGIYYCVLQELKITYHLFSAAGKPVRAVANLTLLPFVAPLKRPTGNSPDLTHLIEIKYGDNLPKLCENICRPTLLSRYCPN